MSGLFPFKGTIRSFKRNRSLLTEEHLIALKGRAKSSFNFLCNKNGDFVN
mgnify:CR=1 FL=1